MHRSTHDILYITIIKKNKIYQKIRDYLCEYLGLQYRFFSYKYP